jgi:Tol biopolymer transport system component
MVAYGVAGALHILDLATTNNQVANSGAVSYQQLRFGRDGALLTYAAIPALNTPSQVYLLDLQTGIPMLVSHALASSGAANDNSDSPDISADGRFIAYRSSSSDLVQGLTNTNSTPNIFLFDRLTGNNSLLSKSTSGDAYANNRSIFPVFSADGHALYFTTWATDLAAQDLNRGSDLFAFSFFYALIVPASPAGSGSFVSWPYVPGKNYEVQFKNNLTDSNWQPVNGTVTNYGNRAWLIDSGADAQKFLRVRSF